MTHSPEVDKSILKMMTFHSDELYCPECTKILTLVTPGHWKCECGLEVEQLTIFEVEGDKDEPRKIVSNTKNIT